MDISAQILSDVTIFTKYSRFRRDLGRRETWQEICERNMNMHIKKYPQLEQEIRDVFEQFVFTKKVLPSMRSLQFGGKPIEISPNRIYNCLAAETEFITSTGVKSFKDFRDGDRISVLTHLGNWKSAVVKSYGTQKLYKIAFTRGRSVDNVWSTSNHRWILRDGRETTDLAAKDILYRTPDTFKNIKYEDMSPEERLGWCYGYVYGDGTTFETKSGKYSQVRLCKKDNSFAGRFLEMGFKLSSPQSFNGDFIAYTGSYDKKPIDPSKDSIEVVRAFVRGYLDVDGHKNPAHYDNENASEFKGIQASDVEHVNFIKTVFPMVGIYISSEQDLTGQTTNIGTRPATSRFNTYSNINAKEQSNTLWSVKEIDTENVREETVWCLEVEDDRSFVLSSGIVTGNCCYLPVDDRHSFSETMFLLLGGTGVGYSVQRKHISKLPPVRKPIRSRRYLIGDSIEGWADAIKALLSAYMGDKSMPKFDFSDIREKGAPLITSGGKAPGPQPLKDCLHNLQKVLDSVEDGEQLSTLQVHDMMCYIADAVLAGGIRRAALICLFDMDDEEMLTCKHGQWWELNPQRGRANNSAVVLRHKVTRSDFDNLWDRIKASGSGEPGIYFTNNEDWGCNPCCFTGDTLVATADGRNAVSIKQLCDEGFVGPVYSVNTHNNQVVVSHCSKVWMSKKDAKIVKITLDDGGSLRCTPDHRIMLRSGQYVQAKDLLPGVSLMPFNSYKRPDRNYRMISSNTGRDLAQYSYVAQYYDITKEGYDKQHIHHKDGNGLNDLASNLEAVNAAEHNREHMVGENNAFFKIKDVEAWKQKQSRGMSGSNNVNSNGLTSDEMKSRIIASTLEHNRVLTSSEIMEACEVKFLSKGRLVELGASTAGQVAKVIHEQVNHKVVSVEELTEREDVYDMTVEGTHNFAVISSAQDANNITSSGVFVHNCEIGLRPYQFCNLVEINAHDIEGQADMNARAKAAAFIGTLQAGYTDFHYIRDIWRRTTEKDALIGVSMTGIASGAILNLDEKEAARHVLVENARVAKLIGINLSARSTCIKPAGTTSCVLGSSSGIHAWHDDYYIRRMRLGKNESLYYHLLVNHAELLEDDFFKPNIQAILSLPMKAPEDAILRHESAISLLERVKRYSSNWVKPGHRKGDNGHNVSATISIKDNEWDEVAGWMWTHRDSYSGLSVLPYSDHSYVQAPFETCTKERYEELLSHITKVDLTQVIEVRDDTERADAIACGANGCEI